MQDPRLATPLGAEDPVPFTTKKEVKVKRCFNCGSTERTDDPPPSSSPGDATDGPPRKRNLLRCTKCKGIFYCCVDCQRADWPEHREACALRSGGEKGLEATLRRMARLAKTKEADARAIAPWLYHPGQSRTLKEAICIALINQNTPGYVVIGEDPAVTREGYEALEQNKLASFKPRAHTVKFLPLNAVMTDKKKEMQKEFEMLSECRRNRRFPLMVRRASGATGLLKPKFPGENDGETQAWFDSRLKSLMEKDSPEYENYNALEDTDDGLSMPTGS